MADTPPEVAQILKWPEKKAGSSQREQQAAVERSETVEESPKERILRIAAMLFAEKGYHGTGVQDLSDAVGLGRGALYWHIKSKEDLLYEISIGLMEPMLERAREIAEREDLDAEQRFRMLARDLVVDLAKHRSGWTVSLHEARLLSDERRKIVFDARDEYENIWQAVLGDGEAEGTFRSVDVVLRKGILGLFNGLYLWFAVDGPMPPEQAADAYSTMILDGLRIR